MAEHTPGPWTNHGRIPQPGLPHSSVAAKTLIARVYSEAYGDTEQETANARLVAAAPDLLDAARAALDDLISDGHAHYRVAETLRAAIEKATGGSHG